MPTKPKKKSFDDIRRSTGRHRGCYVCSAPTVSAVKLACLELNEKREPGSMIASWNRNLCESCAVALYTAAQDAVETTAHQLRMG